MKTRLTLLTVLFLVFGAFAVALPAWGQSTCPNGFRDIQIVNACDNELWLGQQVGSVGAAPGSMQSAQKCVVNNDCSGDPNSYCNQTLCTSNNDCATFTLTQAGGCTQDSDCSNILAGSTCLPSTLCTGVCNVISNNGGDNRCTTWPSSSDGQVVNGMNYCGNATRTMVTHGQSSDYECLGGLCQYFEFYPNENTACSSSNPTCPNGQTCNLLVGLCQHSVPCESTAADGSVSCPSGYACDYGSASQNSSCLLTGCTSSTCAPPGWLCGTQGCTLDPALIDLPASSKVDLCMPGTAGSASSPQTTINQNAVLWPRAGCPNFESCRPVGAKCTSYSDCCSSVCSGGFCANSNLGACLSGDCGGLAICNGPGASRAFTKIEFNLQAPYQQGQNPTDFYDVSLVDGYNVAASFQPMSGTNLTEANQCNSNADCQTSTGQTCVMQNGVGTCTCTAGEKGDCPSPYLCDAKPGNSGMCSIDPYSCGTPGRYGARTTSRGTPGWPAVAIEGCLWDLTQSTCPAELQQWEPILNSGNEVTCTQQSECTSYPGSSCQYAEDRLAGAPGVQQFCSTYVGCMNPNNVCSNANVYGSTGPYANLGCTNQQIALGDIQCSSNADCPAMQGGGLMTCSSGKCVNTCGGSSDCPTGMVCGSQSCDVSGMCVDPVLCAQPSCSTGCTGAAPYSDLYGTTGYSSYTCYSGAPAAFPQQCQGCLLWSDFGTKGAFPGDPLPMSQVVCPASSSGNATNQNFFNAAAAGGQSYSSYAAIYKKACPSAYSAQFDDKTSTFQCIQPPNYVLTFCPQNAGNGQKKAAVGSRAGHWIADRW